jgi:hypothetical protein
VTFDEAVETLKAANIVYTICKFGATRKMAEAKYPYRIVRGELPLPTGNKNTTVFICIDTYECI